MAALSDYLENKLIDFLLRGQAYSAPATVYVALFTAGPTDSGGTEVAGGSYARVPVSCSLANFAGTQAAGSTTASTGSGGQTSNNVKITFPAPTGDWGTIIGAGVYDSATAGNLLLRGSLEANKVINGGDAAPEFAIGELKFTLA